MDKSIIYNNNLKNYEKKNLIYYTPREELINTISHSFGTVFGVFALIILLFLSNDIYDVLGSIFFGFGVILTYTNSAIYHGIKNIEKKSIWRKVDYCSVNFIIVACGAPLCLCMIRHTYNYIALTICLAICFLNVALCLINLKKFAKTAFVLDFASSIIITIAYFVNKGTIPNISKIFFIIAAVLCLSGAFFFGRKKEFLHAVFHILMLVGTQSVFLASFYIISL
jgi:hemolysin III